jgi:hypothetical protein
VNYFQDESDIALLEDVDLWGRPPQHIADQLVEVYFQTVHPAFPVIEKSMFLRQCQSLYTNRNMQPGKRWLAILNLIIAISARHSLLMGNRSMEEYGEHRVYFSRSWWLSRGGDTLFDNPNLQQVQIEALTGFYLLSVGQVNR